jgi:hypothetical protein
MMLAALSLDPAAVLTGPLPNLLIPGLVVLGLANVLLGLVLFRPLTAIHWMLMGAGVGVALAGAWRAEPSTVDFVITGGAMGVLGVILGWMFSRGMFLMLVGWLTAGLVAHVFGGSAGSWVLGVIAGIVVVAAGMRYLRWTAIASTCLAGAAMFVFALLALITGARSWGGLIDRTFGPEGYYMLGYAGIIVGIVLAGVGFAVQNSLADAVTDVFMPKLPKRQKRRKAKGGLRMTPPFAKF